MTSANHSTPTREMPDTYLVIGAIALLVFLLGWLLPPGQFSMVEEIRDGSTVTVVDPESFRFSGEATGTALFSTSEQPGLFNAIFEGLTSGSRTGGAVGIMAFILLTGGAFGIVMATGAIHRGISRVADAASDAGGFLLASLFVLFSLGGAVFGMGEEAIPFVLMLLPVLTRLGYDGVVVVLVTYVATQIGFATSWMNPFSVAIAQGIAQVPVLSGMPLRILMWLVFTIVGLLFTLRYAARIRTAPADDAPVATETAPLGAGDWLVLAALAATVAWIIGGVVFAGYYLPEIATQFVVLGIAAGVIGCIFRLDAMTANGAVAAFRRGAQDLLPAALVVGFAKGIVYLMGGDDPSSPSMLNSLLHLASSGLAGLPDWLAAWSMYAAQSVFNFFVTSGSGQAALTMPLMAPLADLLGVTRQVAVLAFQLGDGFANLVVPTSASLMGCLGAAKLDWLAWLRVALVLFGILFALSSAFVVGATLLGYS